MKRIAFLALCLLASTGWAQTVTIPAKTIPAQTCVVPAYTIPAVTVAVNGPVVQPPVTCVSPQTLVNGVCTTPVVTPNPGQVWTPPAGAFAVYAYGGARGFTLDNSYGGIQVNYADPTRAISPGPFGISVKGNNGGWQPRFRDPGNFSTAGFNSLVLVAILQPGQDFQIGMDQSNGSGGDAIVPGASQAYMVAGGFGPPGDGKTYQVYKIPLGSGGFNLAAGQNILKFSFQNSAIASASTVAYIGGAYFSP